MKKSKNLSTGVIDDTVKNIIRTSHNINVLPRLTIEWNLNRYTSPVVTNTPSEEEEGYDVELFPIESIVESLRPDKGAAKAKVNEAVVSAGHMRHDSPKFYVADSEDTYKYWTSPYVTNASGNFALHTDGQTTARPRVSYDRVVKANKIVIRVENTWASPKTYQVKVSKTLTGSYTAVGGTNPAIDGASGTITLYFNGSSWVSSRPANLVETDVAGIEFSVSAMGPGIRRGGGTMFYTNRGSETRINTTGAKSSLNLISIEARIETDLTSRLISVSDTFDFSETSQLYPIGTITSNVGEFTLSNEDGIFNKENTASPYYRLIEPNAEVNLEYIYAINGVEHSVQQAKMYVSSWDNNDAITSVSMEDYSKFLKEIKPRSFMVENKTSNEIVWRVLDSVGFSNYEIDESDRFDDVIVPVFWTSGEETVWEILDELAKATQTAIYFDHDGKLQVKTRQAAYRDDSTIDWNLLGVKSGTSLPDINTWSDSGEYEANKIDVKYKATKWKTNRLGEPALSQVWETDADTLVVRSTPLIKPIENNSNHIYLDQKESMLWPFKSKVQIDGEVIEYEGKQFVYYTYAENDTNYNNPIKNVVNINSDAEYRKNNSKTPIGKRKKNYYTGALKITERSMWNTEKRDHNVDLKHWSTKMELYGRKPAPVQKNNPSGFRHDKRDSTVIINTPKGMNDEGDTFWATRGGSSSTSYRTYGTRLRFKKDKAATTQMAGIGYQMSGSREAGYYVEIRPSAAVSTKERGRKDEVNVYSRSGGKDTIIARGAPIAIGLDIWYDVDVYHYTGGNVQRVVVFINGQLAAQGSTNASTVQAESGRFGFFARGKTHVEFEYIYAIDRPITEPQDDYGFYDLKYGGIRGDLWQREHVWKIKTRRTKIRRKRFKREEYKHNRYVFDEFSPYVHEVREFDVKFDPTPVRYSYLFNTNEWFSCVPEYYANPFGAKFVIANTARFHAVLKGEDDLVYAGSGAAVNQLCTVLGQELIISDEETVTKKNESAIRSRGLIESELSSDWIQSRAMAEELADWMGEHWSDSVDEVAVEIFGNPLIQLGDIVDVNYPRENASPSSHQYFVTAVENTFENGVITRLTIRRRRPATLIS